MSDEWIGVINTTTPKYMKGASDMTIRKRLFLAMLQRKGRITYNNSGYEMRWQVEFSQPTVQQHGDGTFLDFTNHQAFQQCVLPWGGYAASDSITKKQRAMNKGDEALINLFKTKNGRLMKSIQAKFAGELYKAGGGSGSENAIYGLETFLTEANNAAGNRLSTPNDSYAGLNTNLGDQGGTWTSDLSTYPNATLAKDWPDGSGDTEYDYFAPKLINWSSTGWGTGSTTFEDNCWRVISQAITWMTVVGGDDNGPELCVLAPNLFQSYKNHDEAIRRINVPHKAADDLGFKGFTLNQDGCSIAPDFDCASNTGYMLNTSGIEIASLFPELFWMEGPDTDPRAGYATLWATGFYGQMRVHSPKYVGKLKNFA